MLLELLEQSASYEEKMIEQNDIAALLDFTKLELNGKIQLNYNISRRENLEDFLEANELDRETLRRIILNLQMAYEEISRYLIDERHILLSTETILLEKSSDNFRVKLCYYPKDMGSVQEQFRGVMEYLLRVVPVNDKELTQLVYRIYDITLKEDYTLSEVLDELTPEDVEELFVERIDLRDDIMEGAEIADTSFSDARDLRTDDLSGLSEYDDPFTGEYIKDLNDDSVERKQGIFDQIKNSFKNLLPTKLEFKDSYVSESEDFILDPTMEIEERTVLLSETKPCGKLIYDGQNQEEDFMVNKDVFKIGKSKNNDAILHSPTVSGSHAKITRQGSEFYIMDLNSTNATFVNDEELTYRRPVKLNICDKIRFANVAYTFM